MDPVVKAVTTQDDPAALDHATHLKLIKTRYAAKDWAEAYRLISALNGVSLQPLIVVRLMLMSSVALHHLGKPTESIDQFRACADLILKSGLLAQSDMASDAVQLLLSALLGAGDLASLYDVMRRLYPGYFADADRKIKIAHVVSLAAWGAAHQVARVVVEPAKDIVVTAPGATGKVYEYRNDETWLSVVPNAELISPWDVVIAPTGEILEGSNYINLDVPFAFAPHCYLEELSRIARPWSDTCIEIDKDAFFMSTSEQYHFGHWLVDFLPRLRGWKHPASPATKIAIPAQLPRKQRETLARFGISNDDIIECEIGVRYRFRSLTIVCNGERLNYFRPSPDRIRFVHGIMASAREPRANTKGERHFFLHRAVGTRLIANQHAFSEMLKELNVESIDLSQLSLAEQDQLFSNAGIVMGVFGSDLLSIYQMRPGTDVVEIIWDESEDPVVSLTSAVLGLYHHFFICTSTEPSKVRRRRGVDRDPVVDCGALKIFFQNVLRLRAAPSR